MLNNCVEWSWRVLNELIHYILACVVLHSDWSQLLGTDKGDVVLQCGIIGNQEPAVVSDRL